MQEKTQKILFITIIALLVLTLAFVFWQQRTISALKETVFPSSADVSPQDANQPPQDVKSELPNYLVEAAKNDLTVNTKEIVGKVLEVKESSIIVEAEIVNFEKIAQADSTDIAALPKTKKNFSVAVNDKTEFSSAKLGDIKTGRQIQILSDDLVYKTDKITATKINFPYSTSSVSGGKFVSGKVKEMGNNALTISAVSKDGKDMGIYSVKISKSTSIIKKDLTSQSLKETTISASDIKSGDNVIALAADPVGDRKEFEAVEIDIFISPPPK